MFINMEYWGVCGCELNIGDGVGIFIQILYVFFVKKCKEQGFELFEFGKYGVGVVFFFVDCNLCRQCWVFFDDYIDELGFDLFGYCKILIDYEELGELVVLVEFCMEQVFVVFKIFMECKVLECRFYVLCKFFIYIIYNIYLQFRDQFYLVFFFYKMVIYKGQLIIYQFCFYFFDLYDELCEFVIVFIYSCFFINMVFKWKLVQFFWYIVYNGEINIIMGNFNWWAFKEGLLKFILFIEEELEKLKFICGESFFDFVNFDNVLEFLVLGGMLLFYVLMFMIFEAWQYDE